MVHAYWGDGNTMVVLTKCQSDFYYAARSSGGVKFINGRNYRLYCINSLGWKRENAMADLRKIWDPAEYPIWEQFIEENLPLD
jgi:hypothetical protein